MTKILFLVPYPLKESPSQRFRFEQYFASLKAHGYSYTVQSFFNSAAWLLFYSKGNGLRKIIALLLGFNKRALILFKAPFFNYIFIHREVTPAGPPIIEWIIAHVLRKKIIYDFDDSIWLTDKLNEPWITRFLRWRKKTANICAWSYKVSCGNTYLAAYAKTFNTNTILNPTTIDTVLLHNKDLYPESKPDPKYVTIGWTGSYSTLKYLKLIEEPLQEIEQRFPQARFLVIADRKPELALRNLVFCEWTVETEICDLLKIDIGIMPLPDDSWAKGKCGFKALQYMALEIPCVIAPVGVNIEIIKPGINGFLATTPSEWVEQLSQLIVNRELIKKLGSNGRETVEQHYSVTSNESTFLSLFK